MFSKGRFVPDTICRDAMNTDIDRVKLERRRFDEKGSYGDDLAAFDDGDANGTGGIAFRCSCLEVNNGKFHSRASLGKSLILCSIAFY